MVKKGTEVSSRSGSEAALRPVRRLFVTKENLRRAIATLVNANYAARDPEL